MTIEHGIPSYPVDRRGGYRPPLAIGADQGPTDDKGTGGGFSFGDLIDAVNPLQHIPVISNIYRRMTGDEIGTLPRVAGGAIFGGLIGGAVSVVNAVIERATGDDVGGHILTAFLGDDADPGNAAPAREPVFAATEPEPTEPEPTGAERRQVAMVLPNTPPISLDPLTFDALARTLGSADPLAHLAPPAERPSAPEPPRSAPTHPANDGSAKFAYADALIRMQAGMDQYETRHSDNARPAR